MNVNRIRLRLTLAYAGIFALTLFCLGGVVALGFARELTSQQDDLLTQEARDQAYNVLKGEDREVLAEGSREFSWIALTPDGRVLERDPVASLLGLPSERLARKALEEDGTVSSTTRGETGSVRTVSMPMREEGEVVGVIQYARSLENVRSTVNGLIIVLLPLGLGALGVATIGGAYMSGRAVGPVREALERQRAFIADVSHELKTPITLIRADTEVLQRGLEDPDERELADDVLSEADKMTAVLSDLLLVARLDAGKLPVDTKDFDLAAAVSGATGRFEKRARSAGTRLEVEVPPELPASGDPGRTGQILGVLLDNAFSHAPEGDRVTVSARRTGADLVEVMVRDRGAGIPAEHLPHIFERFYRADKARSRASGGTGLGLSIARDLARAQGGDLTAANAGDAGASFRLRLPAG